MAREDGVSKQKIKKDLKKDKADKALKKDLDPDLIAALADSDGHEQRVELLLIQIVRNTGK